MSIRRLFLLSVILVLSLLPAALFGQAQPARSWAPTGILWASDGGANDNFGGALTLQGDTAIIGATGWGEAPNAARGAAYVFTFGNAGWVERVRLTASDGRAAEHFGSTAALDGGVLAIAAPEARRGNPGSPGFVVDAGAVYIFTGSGATWTEQVKLMPDDLTSSNRFGSALALNGDSLLAGAAYGAGGRGVIYFYTRHNGNWEGPQRLDSPEPTAPHYFGSAVALAGDVALVGAPGIRCCDASAASEKGVVYVFTRSGGVWSPAGSFKPDDGIPGDNFGCDIAFDGTTAVVAACQAYGLPEIHGYAYVFTRNGTTWTQTARLEPQGDTPFPQGISSVALAGDRLVLGARNASPEPYVGRLYPYHRDGATWTRETPIASPNGQPSTGFGEWMVMSAVHLLAGATDLPKLNVPQQGAVYTFVAPPSGHLAYLPFVAAPALESPDGLIAYVAPGVGADNDIFLIRPDGTGKTNLTRSAARESSPVWSPDGRRLAFQQWAVGQPTRIITTNTAGGDRQVIPMAADVTPMSISWSPDGTRLAFVDPWGDARADVFVVKLDGSGLVNLTPAMDGRAQYPRWSPDGTRILFVYEPPGLLPRQLAIVGAGGGAIELLTDDDANHDIPAWSPDGTRILFTAGSDLMTIPAAGGEPTLLVESATMGRWSPDGAHLVFVGDDGGLFRASANGGDITPLDATTDVSDPDWQP